jgi:hypothetical protein
MRLKERPMKEVYSLDEKVEKGLQVCDLMYEVAT